MSRPAKSTKSRAVGKQTGTNSWGALTWDNLEGWAGSRSVSRGRAYQRQGRVKNLACAEDGRLLATVSGTERYVTSAWLTAKRGKRSQIDSECTCPIGTSGCKHAVAVIADYLAALAEKREVPLADPEDRRWATLLQHDADIEDDFEDEDDFDGDDADESDDEDFDSDELGGELYSPPRVPGCSPGARGKKSSRLTRADWDKKIRTHIDQKSQEDLAALVWSLVERFPELRQEFQERLALGEGDVDQLVAAARRELRSVTAEFGWRNHWDGDGHTPNYSGLLHRFERLVEMRHADRVVDLGRELIDRGMDQVGQSDDEGETATAIGECCEIVFDALAKSSLKGPDKILFAIDACLKDDYDVLGNGVNKILGTKWSQVDWSVVVDRLSERLQKLPRGKKQDDFSRNYARDRLSHFLLEALEHAGRKDELLPIYEAEARETGSYERLVSYLISLRRYADAERWASEGIQQTQQKYPGIASDLAGQLCELARRQKRWDIVAAHAASRFLSNPSMHLFKELGEAAKKARCLEAVRSVALKFLETGISPIRVTCDPKKGYRVTADPSWPLPTPEYLLPMLFNRRPQSTPSPHYNVLIDMAIHDKRPKDVLRWYDALTAPKKNSLRGPHYLDGYFDSDRVAKAVAAEFPERALEIYRRKLESQLRHTGQSAYEQCALYLRAMRPIYRALDQQDHWNELLADIRHKYGNRPRFMEVLDQLEGRTIVQSHRHSRRR